MAEQAKLKKRLEALIKLPENLLCADCRKRGPRWASANLGIFMCIECSGIHRGLGVHISFVRSVNLDTWTQKQVDFMEEWGNKRANLYYEYNMPAGYPIPKEGDAIRTIEKFIREKYEAKKFMGPVPGPNGSLGGAVEETAARIPIAPMPNSGGFGAPKAGAVKAAAPQSNLLDFMDDPPAPVAAPVAAASNHNDFGNFGGAPASSQSNDMFGSFNSAPAAPATDVFGSFGGAAPAAPASQANDMFGSFSAAPAPKPLDVMSLYGSAQPQQQQRPGMGMQGGMQGGNMSAMNNMGPMGGMGGMQGGMMQQQGGMQQQQQWNQPQGMGGMQQNNWQQQPPQQRPSIHGGMMQQQGGMGMNMGGGMGMGGMQQQRPSMQGGMQGGMPGMGMMQPQQQGGMQNNWQQQGGMQQQQQWNQPQGMGGMQQQGRPQQSAPTAPASQFNANPSAFDFKF